MLGYQGEDTLEKKFERLSKEVDWKTDNCEARIALLEVEMKILKEKGFLNLMREVDV